jgi:hypothetical protein
MQTRCCTIGIKNTAKKPHRLPIKPESLSGVNPGIIEKTKQLKVIIKFASNC